MTTMVQDAIALAKTNPKARQLQSLEAVYKMLMDKLVHKKQEKLKQEKQVLCIDWNCTCARCLNPESSRTPSVSLPRRLCLPHQRHRQAAQVLGWGRQAKGPCTSWFTRNKRRCDDIISAHALTACARCTQLFDWGGTTLPTCRACCLRCLAACAICATSNKRLGCSCGTRLVLRCTSCCASVVNIGAVHNCGGLPAALVRSHSTPLPVKRMPQGALS